MKYLIAIILILTLFTGCYNHVKRWENNDLIDILHEVHPTRPDICPQEYISRFILGSIWFKPGDKVYTAAIRNHPKSKHQRCNDLYGGCSYYGRNLSFSTSCIELPYPMGYTTEETCLAKGGKWQVSLFGDPIWCSLPYIEE